ncbi:hypothetical protein [Nannocystis pusilla]|uniref:hypothetical protein n=1 Tax=Nannocystis pusilla TaxID=889268 RepID=UPI003B767D62
MLLQLEHEPTFVIVSAGDPTQPFGRVPAFTLYRDGTVLFTRDSEQRRGLFIYSVFEWAAKDHIEHVRASASRACAATSTTATLRRSDGSAPPMRA